MKTCRKEMTVFNAVQRRSWAGLRCFAQSAQDLLCSRSRIRALTAIETNAAIVLLFTRTDVRMSQPSPFVRVVRYFLTSLRSSKLRLCHPVTPPHDKMKESVESSAANIYKNCSIPLFFSVTYVLTDAALG